MAAIKLAFSVSNPGRAIQAAQLYSSGLSTREIAAQLLVGRSTVSLDLRSVGVTMDGAARISAKAKGRPSHRMGATHTAEARAQMSLRRIGKTPTLGTRRTDEQKARMSLIQKGSRKPHAKTAAGYLSAVEAVFGCGRTALVVPGLVLPSAKMIGVAQKLFTDPIDVHGVVIARKNILSTEERHARGRARNSYKQMLRRVLVMSRTRKNLPAERLLGYTQAELKAHIESQFTPAMSWANRASFHIDHKVPVAAFLRRGVIDPAVINALSNLQPLTPLENQKKSDRMLSPWIQSV